jgi:hypothetical protein
MPADMVLIITRERAFPGAPARWPPTAEISLTCADACELTSQRTPSCHVERIMLSKGVDLVFREYPLPRQGSQRKELDTEGFGRSYTGASGPPLQYRRWRNPHASLKWRTKTQQAHQIKFARSKTPKLRQH